MLVKLLHFDVFLADRYYFIAYILLLYALFKTVPISFVDILPSPSISKWSSTVSNWSSLNYISHFAKNYLSSVLSTWPLLSESIYFRKSNIDNPFLSAYSSNVSIHSLTMSGNSPSGRNYSTYGLEIFIYPVAGHVENTSSKSIKLKS